MQVKMLTAMAGERWSVRAGAVAEMPHDLALRLIAGGQASHVEEAAIMPEAENAALRTKTIKRKRGK